MILVTQDTRFISSRHTSCSSTPPPNESTPTKMSILRPIRCLSSWWDNCSRAHVKPTTSPTVVIPRMFCTVRQQHTPESAPEKQEVAASLCEFYKRTWGTFSKNHGRILELHVVDNLCHHLEGNVYVRFEKTEAATSLVQAFTSSSVATQQASMDSQEELHTSYVANFGENLKAQLCSILDFGELSCRAHEEGEDAKERGQTAVIQEASWKRRTTAAATAAARRCATNSRRRMPTRRSLQFLAHQKSPS